MKTKAPKRVKSIESRRKVFVTKLAEYGAKLLELQKECKHPNATKQYKSDTGNYDPMHDSYWTEHKCPDCEKFWTENQK